MTGLPLPQYDTGRAGRETVSMSVGILWPSPDPLQAEVFSSKL
jgi:hypothetical protein